MTTNSKIKLLFSDIIRGYTKIMSSDFGILYFKHFGPFDSAFIDEIYSSNLEKAIKSGLPTKEIKEKLLIENNQWTKEEEKKINESNDLLIRLKTTRSKIFKKKEKDIIDKQIKDVTKEYDELNNKKTDLIGLTAETFANKKINEHYMKNMLYKDSLLTTTLYNEEEYEDLEDEKLNKLYSEHEKYIENFSVKNLKCVALSPAYMNLFIISNDNPYTFYGKPVIYLTFYQTQVFEYAKTFKNILVNSKNKVPDDLMQDPEKLLEWYDSSQQAEDMLSKTNKKDKDFVASSLVGATKEDLKAMGMDSSGSNLSNNIIKEAQKKGGSLSIDDMIRLQGA